jgi:hypothetical protein
MMYYKLQPRRQTVVLEYSLPMGHGTSALCLVVNRHGRCERIQQVFDAVCENERYQLWSAGSSRTLPGSRCDSQGLMMS